MAAAKKSGLGRGLEELFGAVEINPEAAEKTPKSTDKKKEEKTEKEGEALLYLDINKIKPNEGQPRKKFDEEKTAELASSILEHGIIQPLIVRKVKNGYEIVAGERRYRAARVAKLKQVPCRVMELSDKENALLSIIENVQREDLNGIDEATAFDKLINTYGLTQEQVSKSVGKSRPYITNSLRLLKLPEEIRNMVVNNELSQGHARALINIEDKKKQLILANRAKNEGLSVRVLEQLAGALTTTKKPEPKKAKVKDPDVARVEEELKQAMGTKVNIVRRGNKGRIEIEYYSRDELERLIELMRTL